MMAPLHVNPPSENGKTFQSPAETADQVLVHQFFDGVLLSPAPTDQLHDPLCTDFLLGAVGLNRRPLLVSSALDHHGTNLSVFVHGPLGFQIVDLFGFLDLIRDARHSVELFLRQIVHPLIGIFSPTDKQRPPFSLPPGLSRQGSGRPFLVNSYYETARRKTHQKLLKISSPATNCGYVG